MAETVQSLTSLIRVEYEPDYDSDNSSDYNNNSHSIDDDFDDVASSSQRPNGNSNHSADTYTSLTDPMAESASPIGIANVRRAIDVPSTMQHHLHTSTSFPTSATRS